MSGFAGAFHHLLNPAVIGGMILPWDRPDLAWAHAVGDGLMALAFLSMSVCMVILLRRRPDLHFGWAISTFVVFMLLDGLTHFLSTLSLWRPVPEIESLAEAATIVAAAVTAVALWPLLRKVKTLPSPAQLQNSIQERDEALEELRAAMGAMVEMREHERRQRLLLDELNHRVKNTLASVQSIAMQTMDYSPNPDAFQETFLSRLMSLSSTHDVLVRREWQSARLSELITSTLAHYGRPYRVVGPDLWLSPNTAVTLGLALHELSTNALKHGAWSATKGRVDLSTAVKPDGRVTIVWRETGGPAVSKPERNGFGSRLLRRGVARDLDGEVSLDFDPDGLTCTIRTPGGSDRIREVPPEGAGILNLHE